MKFFRVKKTFVENEKTFYLIEGEFNSENIDIIHEITGADSDADAFCSSWDGLVVYTEEEIRSQRDFKLTTEVDPIVTNPLRWAELTSEKQEEWKQYRRDLLEIPQQLGFPNDVIWPEKPL